MEFFDTHCHIHEIGFELSGDEPTRAAWLRANVANPDQVIADAQSANVTQLICVGTTYQDSLRAIDFVSERPGCWASIGIHPHEAAPALKDGTLNRLSELASEEKVVAIGECGLDYFYNHSPKKSQIAALRLQLELATKHDLPLIFHVREAFDDFWPILDEYKGIRGVVHSFTDLHHVLDKILSRGLYVGLNGIMTFTKNLAQTDMAKEVPLQKILLETDAPYLTPKPFRGTVCVPKHLVQTAEFLAKLRGESLEVLANATSDNAKGLFGV